MTWVIDWACEYCGYSDATWADIVAEIQCPMCGEAIVPLTTWPEAG